MKERPILFSGAMVRAILDGTKTQTRRVVTPTPPDCWAPEVGPYHPTCVDRHGEEYPGEELFGASDDIACRRSPYGVIGDRLWVRETLRQSEDGGWVYASDGASIEMYEDDPRVPAMVSWAHHVQREVCVSIHMPRWASRLTLEITGIRVERLQAISEADCEAEGTQCPQCNGNNWSEQGGEAVQCDCRICGDGPACYRVLWDSINEKRGYGWDANPWVWVISFQRATDSLAGAPVPAVDTPWSTPQAVAAVEVTSSIMKATSGGET